MLYEEVLNQQRILQELAKERFRQDDKWGENRNMPPADWMLILTEEVGESAKSILDRDVPVGLREELVQVAAISVAIIEWIDRGAIE